MHKTRPDWGKSGLRFLDDIQAIIEGYKPVSILDYGCGKGALVSQINQRFPHIVTDLYDPGVPEFDYDPFPADFVICTDVLEHIEPDLIENVVEHLAELSQVVCYMVIHTGDCGHKLPDGSPAHILQQPQGWWMDLIDEKFNKAGFSCLYQSTELPMRFKVIASLEVYDNAVTKH